MDISSKSILETVAEPSNDKSPIELILIEDFTCNFYILLKELIGELHG